MSKTKEKEAMVDIDKTSTQGEGFGEHVYVENLEERQKGGLIDGKIQLHSPFNILTVHKCTSQFSTGKC